MKKLLGLLVAPMALTACGSAAPVVEKDVKLNTMSYSEDTLTLYISNISLTGDEDYDGYDQLGRDIKEFWNENIFIEGATRIILKGEINGTTFDKEVDVDGIYNDTNETTPFDNFKGALEHYYKQTENMTTYANFAFHLKDAGDHFVPTEILKSEEDDLQACIEAGFVFENDSIDTIMDANIDQDAALDILSNSDGGWSKAFYLYTDEQFDTHGIDDSYTSIIRNCTQNTLFDFSGWSVNLEWNEIKSSGKIVIYANVLHESLSHNYPGFKNYINFVHDYN